MSRAIPTSEPHPAGHRPRHPSLVLRGGRRIATTNTFTATRIGQADYALQDSLPRCPYEGARLARETANRFDGIVAGSVGPLNVSLSLSPRVDDPAYRSRRASTRSWRRTRSRSARSREAASICSSSRPSSTRSTARPRSSPRICRARAAALALVHGRSTASGPEPLRTDRRGVLDLRSSMRSRSFVGVNCSLGATEMRPYVEDRVRSRRRGSHATRTPACLTRSVSTIRMPRTGRSSASSPRRPGQHRRRLLRHDARAYPQIAAAVEGAAPRVVHECRADLQRDGAVRRPPDTTSSWSASGRTSPAREFAAHPGGRLQEASRSRRAGRGGAQHHRRQHGRACSTARRR